MTGLSPDARNISWLVSSFVQRVPGVALDQARHQRAAAPIDDLGIGRVDLVSALDDRVDPVAAQEHRAGKARRAGTVEHRDVAEEHRTIAVAADHQRGSPVSATRPASTRRVTSLATEKCT